MNARRVVVTGIGMVTPLGHTLADTCDALRRNVTAFASPSGFDASRFTERLGAEVRGFDATPYFRVRKTLKVAHRVTRFAVAAAAMALLDAGWSNDLSREDLGVIIGTSTFDPQVYEIVRALAPDDGAPVATDIRLFAERILSKLNPLWLLVGLPNMASSHVSIQLEARGPNSTVMTDWVAGSQAIGEALQWIQNREATAVLAGGADTALFPLVYASYEQAGLFDRAGDDTRRFVPGEGAAVLLLEDRDHALARGARLKGEIRSYATAAGAIARDAGPGNNPLSRTMQAALDDGKLKRSDVRVIGTASVLAQPFLAVEDQAVKDVMGSAAGGAWRVEFTSRLGHGFAAASAIDAALLLELYGSDGEDALVCNALAYGGSATTLALSGAGYAYGHD